MDFGRAHCLDQGNPEFLAEFANVNHRNILTNFVTNSQAFYAQVGYRLPWLERTLKPTIASNILMSR